MTEKQMYTKVNWCETVGDHFMWWQRTCYYPTYYVVGKKSFHRMWIWEMIQIEIREKFQRGELVLSIRIKMKMVLFYLIYIRLSSQNYNQHVSEQWHNSIANSKIFRHNIQKHNIAKNQKVKIIHSPS